LAYILNIETATKNCSVSIAKNDQIVALVELNDGSYSHSENLHSFIQQALKESNLKRTDLDAVAVSMGPGSYTGLRIGVSAAKGLCFALDIPMIAIPTLEILAQGVRESCGFIIPLLDARRMEVYSCIFKADHTLVRDVAAQIVDASSFQNELQKGPVYFAGDGVTKCKSIIINENAVFIENMYPTAKEMASLAHLRYIQNEFVDVAYFEPYYLKDFMVSAPKKTT
jgi:tRNA threonylcarbamoyladenosine biosynthesis protein TsaB